ncbi:unnamed protein product [Arabis nemorensis]|uniref:Uncharacterized protein n=1 Tax=Arabis nemorensis TaxID=586526 RepID=A0A565CDN6_9BRAS|nr:unnamed protein product [Arabis nemorensis]
MFVNQLEREGLILLDQFEELQLTPSESSDLTGLFNKVSLPDPDVRVHDLPMDRKVFESSFQNTKDHI